MGERDKEWASLSRVFASKPPFDAATEAIAAATEGLADVMSRVHGTGDVITAHPVIGPSGVVHALVLWHGPADEVPAVRPRAAAFDWSSVTRDVVLTPEMRAIVGLDNDRSTLTGPEMFRSISQFDGALEAVAKTFRRGPDKCWIGPYTVRTPDGFIPVRAAMRSLAEPNDTVWHGALYELTRPVPSTTPSAESIALAALSRQTDTAIALVDLERLRIVRWITDPIPDIAWKGVRDQRDTPHPDDVLRIVSAIRNLHRGATESTVPGVRLRRTDFGWTIVDIRATVFPAPDGLGLLLCEFQTVGRTDDPDPVPADDTGYTF